MKLGILSKVRRYFTPGQLLTLYTAQVRSCMEYCSHLWDGSARYQLDTLDAIDRRARRLIGDDELVNNKLQSLEHRCKVACLSVFYRIHFGECAQELHDLIPPAPFHHRSTRRREGLHPYVVDVPFLRTNRDASSFIMRTAKGWNSLPASVFPDSYNLNVFKARVNRHYLSSRVPSSTASLLPIRLSLISITSSQTLNTGREDNGICREMLCDSIETLMHLSDCVVVLGDLKITIKSEDTNTSSFKNIQFPELREVTGAVAVYRVLGLESLGQLFPNLARVRGTHLIYNFGLMVYDMPDLREVGLYSLLKIDRGGVNIWGGPHTCFISTVDWSAIAPNSQHVLAAEGGHCRTTCTCGADGWDIKHTCWNTKHCQHFLEGPDAEAGRCHPQCLGCSNDPNHCVLCRNYTYRHTCVADCPRDTLILKDNQYCVTTKECKDLVGISFNGTCLLECPVEYTRAYNSDHDIDTCKLTDYQNTCGSLKIQSLSTIQSAESCVYIRGSLTIHIRLVPEAMVELRKYLSRVQEVTDYIVIYGSTTITSLDFFSSLKVIKGKQLLNKAYSLVIHDMDNIESLFTTNVTRNLIIERGKLRVIKNPRLCKSKIDEILPLFPESSNETDLPFEMNGYGRDCDGKVDLHVQVISETSAKITFSPLPYPKVQYTLLYIKLPSGSRNTTFPETCSDSEWYSMSASSGGVVNLKYLHPGSTYAVCIEIFAYSNKPKERKHSRSKIVNFTTLVGKPAAPFITEIYATSANDVTLRWVNHKYYRPYITHYELDVSLIEIHSKDIAARDHCKHIEVAVEDPQYSRHTIVLRPPQNYERSCESMCEHLTSTTATVVPEEHFDLCDYLNLDGGVYEAPVPNNTYLNSYIRTSAIVIKSHRENYNVTGLAPFRDYRFRLRACVESKCSVSNRAVVRTLRSQEADVPSIVYCAAINFTSIIVQWSSPNDTNGPIFAYIIQVLPVINDDTNTILPESVCVSANQYNLVVESKISTDYQVRVCATTLGSISACSDWRVITSPNNNSFLWGLSFGILLTVISVMLGYYWRMAPDHGDLVPLVRDISENHIESELPSLMVSVADFGTLYTVPLRETLIDY